MPPYVPYAPQFKTSADRDPAMPQRPQMSPFANTLPFILGAGAANRVAESLPTIGQIGSTVGNFMGAGVTGSVPATPVAIGHTVNGGSIIPAGGTSILGKAVPGIIGAIAAYDALKNQGNNLRGYGQAGLGGAGIGFSVGGPIGAGIGAGVGLLAKGAMDIFGGGKHPDQIQRDRLRTFLEGKNFIDQTHTSPTGFNYGLDGSNRITNAQGAQRRQYEVDLEDPLARQAIDLLNPLGYLITAQSGIDPRQRSNAVGMLVNDATSNATTPEQLRANVLAQYHRYGLTPDQVVGGLQEMQQRGFITPEEAQVGTAHIDSISTNPAARQQQGQMPAGYSVNYSMPAYQAPPPSLDFSGIKAPGDPLAASRAAYDNQKPMPEFMSNLSLFPQRRQQRQGYQPLGAFA